MSNDSLNKSTSSMVESVSEHYKTLNFKVPPEFHHEFKIWAARHDMSMTALLLETFNSYCRENRLQQLNEDVKN